MQLNHQLRRRMMIKKIAILTSGGDAPGMNNAVRAVVKKAFTEGIEAYAVYEGYKGLVENNIKRITASDVDQHLAQGGTFIYSARYPEFQKPEVKKIAVDNLSKLGIDALVVIGGDGSYRGAQSLHERGVKAIGLPGTIDNDITSSIFTIGYDTALNTIVKAVDQIRDTANSHNRVMIVEVMGRDCGDLALYGGIASGAEIIITSEAPLKQDEIVKKVKEQRSKGKRGIIVLTTEKMFDDVSKLAGYIEKKTGYISRGTVLGHIQRGGEPTAMERVRATVLGIRAVELLIEGKSGLALGIGENEITATPILEALEQKRTDRVKLAKDINKINQQ